MKQENHDLAKWLASEMTETERLAFEETPDFATYLRIAKFSSELETPTFNEESMLQNITSRPKQKVVKMKINWATRIAAVLIVSLGSLSVWYFTSITEIAKAGEEITFQLPDNSEVILNSGSEINYKKWNWNQHRALELKGEAYFKVAKGKVFDVSTSLGKVTVVGTQFNVKSRGSRMEVDCYEGKVRVQNNNQVVYIHKGERVLFENDKQSVTSFSDASSAWLNNEMAFESENLTAIAAEMERQYAVEITIKNVSAQHQFTGTIPSNDLDVALEIICKTFHLKATKAKAKIILDGK